MPLPHTTEAYGQFLGRDFNPLDLLLLLRTDSPVFSAIKMPSVKKYGNVTMEKGVFKSDNTFWDWFNQIKMNTIKRVPVTISLLDEAGKPTMVWTLTNV
jgi:hypothetical protein